MPWTLADVLGQQTPSRRLAREFALGRLAHAYLVEGPQGSGKLAFTHGLAALALCSNPDGETGEACQTCRPCHMLRNGNHPDYLELPRDPAELRIARFVERTGPSTESVEHEPLLKFLRLRPVEGGRRVAVIPDAERMRPESANAFLKTLEEPPGDTLIVLTTSSRDRLPATILSRCRRVGLAPLSVDLLAAELERRGVASGQDARDLAVTAEGSLGAALGLAEGGTTEFWRWLESEALVKPGAASAIRLADGWIAHAPGSGDNAGKRKSAMAALDLTALAIRRRMRSDLAPAKAAAALAALWTAGDQVTRNVRPDLVLLSTAMEVMAALR